MTLLEAIRQANDLRPNDISDEIKAGWLFKLEGEFAELMGVAVPENPFPEDADFLMPHPHDDGYVLYLAAMLDNANQDSALYANDMTMANSAIISARKWWRRNNAPTTNNDLKVM